MNKSITFYELLYLIGLNYSLDHWSWWALIPLILFFPKWGQIAGWVEVALHKDKETDDLIEEVENEIKSK
jgi:hypothetical protein